MVGGKNQMRYSNDKNGPIKGDKILILEKEIQVGMNLEFL